MKHKRCLHPKSRLLAFLLAAMLVPAVGFPEETADGTRRVG